MTGNLIAPDLSEQIAELERELEQRARVYPRMIERKTLSLMAADRQVTRMQAALETLRMVEAQRKDTGR